MSDRSSCSFTIYACPEEHREAALRAINENLGWEDAELQIGELYEEEQASLNTMQDLANALIEVSPDITFDAQQDPAYEFLGERFIQVAGLGYYSALCDVDGRPYLDAEEVLPVFDTATSVEDARAKVAALFGVPFREALVQRLARREADRG